MSGRDWYDQATEIVGNCTHSQADGTCYCPTRLVETALAAAYRAGQESVGRVTDAEWQAAEAVIERWRTLSDADATAELIEDRAAHVRAGRVAMRR